MGRQRTDLLLDSDGHPEHHDRCLHLRHLRVQEEGAKTAQEEIPTCTQVLEPRSTVDPVK